MYRLLCTARERHPVFCTWEKNSDSCLSHTSYLSLNTSFIFFISLAMRSLPYGRLVKIWTSEPCSICYWQTILYSSWKGIEEWYKCTTNMDVLVALWTSASYLYSVCALLYGATTGFWPPTYFETSAMLITFVLLGKYLEILAKGKTSETIKKLVELSLATDLLLSTDAGGKIIEEREIDALLIHPGDTLKVIPGSKIPIDGVVIWAGESAPIQKEVNSPVIGGTINLHGALHVQATKVRSNTVLSQIISLVEAAQMSKAPVQKFADFVGNRKLLTENGI